MLNRNQSRYLYKAKRIDGGGWVQGYYVKGSDMYGKETHVIFEPDAIFYSHGETDGLAEIDPSTICQCTGLCDKNGKKIWENDILKTWDDQYAQVKFGLYNTGFASGDYNQGFYAAFPKDSYYRHELGYWCKESYVRGNIFDNPELLKCESDFEVSDS